MSVAETLELYRYRRLRLFRYLVLNKFAFQSKFVSWLGEVRYMGTMSA